MLIPMDQNQINPIVFSMEESGGLGERYWAIKGRQWAPRIRGVKTDCVQSELPGQAPALLLSGQRTQRSDVTGKSLRATQQGKREGGGKVLRWTMPPFFACASVECQWSKLAASLPSPFYPFPTNICRF